MDTDDSQDENGNPVRKSKKLSMDMPDEEDEEESESTPISTEGGLRWINMVAYVVCEKFDTRLNDRSAAINNITSKMKENAGFFKAKDEEIKIVYDEGRDICNYLTICKFLLAVELKEPIDSPEFEKMLAKKFSPVGVDDDDEEEEEEEE